MHGRSKDGALEGRGRLCSHALRRVSKLFRDDFLPIHRIGSRSLSSFQHLSLLMDHLEDIRGDQILLRHMEKITEFLTENLEEEERAFINKVRRLECSQSISNGVSLGIH